MKERDENPYKLENVSLFETLYGKSLISLGGIDAIENMFSGIALQGLTALDVGFGLGGVAYYLAKTYNMKISGVELHPWMVDYAKQHAPTDLGERLVFRHYQSDGIMPFAAGSFDIVYSKGVLNHVFDKITLFKQIKALLKRDGFFVVADWIYPNATNHTKSGLVQETQATYQSVLENAGFSSIHFRDDSKIFVAYVKAFMQNLEGNRQFITKNYGQMLFDQISDEHHELLNTLSGKQKIAVRIIAKS